MPSVSRRGVRDAQGSSVPSGDDGDETVVRRGSPRARTTRTPPKTAAGRTDQAETEPPDTGAQHRRRPNMHGVPGDSLIGKIIGGCRIVDMIGHGNMGTVWKGEQIHVGNRPVAVKTMRPDFQADEALTTRFQNEALAAGQLRTDYVVKVLLSGYQDGRNYLVMEYVTGGTLDQYRRSFASAQGVDPVDARLDHEECLRLMIQAARGLLTAETAPRPLVHRDIKPDNILLEDVATDGVARKEVRIGDFGAAKILDLDLTQKSHAPMTPRYASPEQWNHEQDLDHRSDMYSLGATFYHMLVGGPAAQGTERDIVEFIRKTPFLSPRALRKEVPEDLDRVIRKMTARDRDQRFASFRDLVTALEQIVEGRRPRFQAPPKYLPGTWARAKLVAWIVTASAAVILGVGAVLWLAQRPVEQLSVEEFRTALRGIVTDELGERSELERLRGDLERTLTEHGFDETQREARQALFEVRTPVDELLGSTRRALDLHATIRTRIDSVDAVPPDWQGELDARRAEAADLRLRDLRRRFDGVAPTLAEGHRVLAGIEAARADYARTPSTEQALRAIDALSLSPIPRPTAIDRRLAGWRAELVAQQRSKADRLDRLEQRLFERGEAVSGELAVVADDLAGDGEDALAQRARSLAEAAVAAEAIGREIDVAVRSGFRYEADGDGDAFPRARAALDTIAATLPRAAAIAHPRAATWSRDRRDAVRRDVAEQISIALVGEHRVLRATSDAAITDSRALQAFEQRVARFEAACRYIDELAQQDVVDRARLPEAGRLATVEPRNLIDRLRPAFQNLERIPNDWPDAHRTAWPKGWIVPDGLRALELGADPPADGAGVAVPRFQLGEDDVPMVLVSGRDDATPFLVDVDEVTLSRFARYLGGARRARPGDFEHLFDLPRGGGVAVKPGYGDDTLVARLTLGEASAFAEWVEKSVPTSEQWLRAARGGDRERRYTTGSAPPPGLRMVDRRPRRREVAADVATSGARGCNSGVAELCRDGDRCVARGVTQYDHERLYGLRRDKPDAETFLRLDLESAAFGMSTSDRFDAVGFRCVVELRSTNPPR